MKRRIACMVMAVMLVISLLPLGAIPVKAASSLTYSSNVVSMIEGFEGFSSTAYWDGSRWTIGYGTAATSSSQTITYADAYTALCTELTTINAKVNEFAANHNLVLTQYRHDALVSFSYNCGTSWMTDGGRFYQAVVNQTTDVNTFLFAICLWANNGSTPDANLLNRRLAEANLYLNGVYSTSAPSAYTYVIFDANGGTAGSGGEDKMQGYLSGSNVSILAADPTRSGYSFGGWFTSATGGSGVKYLSSATSKATLYAQWGTPVSVTSSYCYVRNGAGSNYTQTGTVSSGTQIVIVETATVNGVEWGRYIDGWVELSNTNYISGGTTTTSSTTSTAVSTGTVVCSTSVNIRSGAGTGYTKVGTAYNGQTVSIYETVSVNGTFWGRIGTNQWICLSYVKLNSSTSSTTGTTTTGGTSGSVVWEGTGTTTTTSYQLGTVTASALRVRSGAGTSYSTVGTLTKGTQVKIYSQTTVNGVLWGQTDSGWVCMNYITLTSTGTTGTTTTSGTVIATGTVNSNTNLSVRSGAGTGYTRLGYIVGGTTINIYETATVNGVQWGRIGTNQWVCLAYVTLTSSTGTTSTTTATTGTGTVISSTNLRIRSGAGTSYTTVGYLTPGSTVTVYEVTTNGTQQWGRIGTNQWVCMTYVKITSSSTGTTSNTTTTSSSTLTGTVTASQLRVRAAAGTSSAIVGYVTSGTTVTIYETTTVNGVSWGRISSGWICLSYVTITGTTSTAVWQ